MQTNYSMYLIFNKISINLKSYKIYSIFFNVIFKFKIGDRILSVNNQDVRTATQEETIVLIKNAGCNINLVLQSFDANV